MAKHILRGWCLKGQQILVELQIPEEYSEPFQTSKMKRSTKIINDF